MLQDLAVSRRDDPALDFILNALRAKGASPREIAEELRSAGILSEKRQKEIRKHEEGQWPFAEMADSTTVQQGGVLTPDVGRRSTKGVDPTASGDSGTQHGVLHQRRLNEIDTESQMLRSYIDTLLGEGFGPEQLVEIAYAQDRHEPIRYRRPSRLPFPDLAGCIHVLWGWPLPRPGHANVTALEHRAWIAKKFAEIFR